MSTTRSSNPSCEPVQGGPAPRGRRVLRGAAVRAAILLAAVSLAALPDGCTVKEGAKPSGTAAGGGNGAIGTPAPEFALQDLDGKTVHIADFSGKVVILDFWATWCPPCRKEIPDFLAMQSKYGDKGLTIVGLSLDAGGAHDVRTFEQEHKINFNYPVLIANEETANAYGGVVGIPTTFVIDRKGKIVKRFVGYTPASDFEETIRPLLEAS